MSKCAYHREKTCGQRRFTHAAHPHNCHQPTAVAQQPAFKLTDLLFATLQQHHFGNIAPIVRFSGSVGIDVCQNYGYWVTVRAGWGASSEPGCEFVQTTFWLSLLVPRPTRFGASVDTFHSVPTRLCDPQPQPARSSIGDVPARATVQVPVDGGRTLAPLPDCSAPTLVLSAFAASNVSR